MSTYSTIVFMEGDDGRDALDILDSGDIHGLFEHLLQWDYGEDHDIRGERPWVENGGHCTYTFPGDDDWHYVVNFHLGLGYVSLNRVFFDGCNICMEDIDYCQGHGEIG